MARGLVSYVHILLLNAFRTCIHVLIQLKRCLTFIFVFLSIPATKKAPLHIVYSSFRFLTLYVHLLEIISVLSAFWGTVSNTLIIEFVTYKMADIF